MWGNSFADIGMGALACGVQATLQGVYKPACTMPISYLARGLQAGLHDDCKPLGRVSSPRGVRTSPRCGEMDQFVLWNVVKELFQVNVHYPLVPLVEVFHEPPHGSLTAPARAEAVAVLLELRLKNGGEDLDD